MRITIGTFNLNNLFSRWDLYVDSAADTAADGSGAAAPAAAAEPQPAWLRPTVTADTPAGAADTAAATPLKAAVTITVEEGADGLHWKWRSFMGRRILAKTPEARTRIAERLLEPEVDVWCVQEVESLVALEDFARDYRLREAGFKYAALVEGNDERLIDVGVLSKLPLGAITSSRFATHPEDPGQRVFSRDLLQVDVLDQHGGVAISVFTTHLKSQLSRDEVERTAAATRRRRQAETVRTILDRRRNPLRRVVLTGDMNDSPDSVPLAAIQGSELVNALEHAGQTREYDPSDPFQPSTTAWTHRFKPAGEPARYELYDQIWVSPDLADGLQSPTVGRRKLRGGDGSDHDPAWVTVTVP